MFVSAATGFERSGIAARARIAIAKKSLVVLVIFFAHRQYMKAIKMLLS